MKNIYLVVSLIAALPAFRRIYAAFEDKELAEAFSSRLASDPEQPKTIYISAKPGMWKLFRVEFCVKTVELIEFGSEKSNEIMLA